MNKEEILEKLKDTSVFNEYQKIEAIYRDLEEKQITFCDTFDIHCKKGCGTCCEHFIPDIYKIEARYLALGLVLEGKTEEAKERIAKWDKECGFCPLYDFDWHMSVLFRARSSGHPRHTSGSCRSGLSVQLSARIRSHRHVPSESY